MTSTSARQPSPVPGAQPAAASPSAGKAPEPGPVPTTPTIGGIVAVGYRSGGFFAGPRPAAELPGRLDREDLASCLERIRETLAQHAAVVAVYPAWAAEPALRRLRTIRSALTSSRLAFAPSAASPLAGGVLVTMAAALAPVVSSTGALHAAVPLLEQQLVSLTWLTRLSRLERPAPSVWQHALSLLPTTAFVASTWPEPAVHRLTRHNPSVPLPRPKATIAVAVADDRGERSWLDDHVLPTLGTPPVTTVDVTELNASYWGAHPHLETVAYPTDLQAVARWLDSQLHRRLCRWCRAEIAALICPFCGMAATGPSVEER